MIKIKELKTPRRQEKVFYTKVLGFLLPENDLEFDLEGDNTICMLDESFNPNIVHIRK